MKRQVAIIDNTDPDHPFVTFNATESFKSDLNSYKNGQRIWLSTEKYFRKRTLSQNNTFFWWIGLIAEDTGMDQDEVKDFFAKKYLTVEIRDENDDLRCDEETGEVMTRVRSTAELNTVEFGLYLDKVWLYSTNFFNMVLPQPDPELKK